MIHCVIATNRSNGKITYLSLWAKAEQAYVDAMIYATNTHGIWNAIVDKKEYVNELLDENLSIKPCPLQG